MMVHGYYLVALFIFFLLLSYPHPIPMLTDLVFDEEEKIHRKKDKKKKEIL
jgi:hypothetical protein